MVGHIDRRPEQVGARLKLVDNRKSRIGDGAQVFHELTFGHHADLEGGQRQTAVAQIGRRADQLAVGPQKLAIAPLDRKSRKSKVGKEDLLAMDHEALVNK